MKLPNVTHNTHTTCTVIASDRLSEKLKKLKVDGSLQISILSGLLDIKGSANFLNKNPINPSESIVHVRCHHRTVVKSLTNDQLSKGKVRYADFSSRPGFNHSATHIITEIQYGSESTFTFWNRRDSTQDKQTIDDRLASCASEIVNLLIGKTLLVDNPHMIDDNIIECRFESDFKLPDDVSPPTNLKESLMFASQFNKILSRSMIRTVDNEPFGVSCLISLYPLVNLSAVDSVPRLRQEISNTVASRCVRLMEDYEDMEDEIESLLKDPLMAKLNPPFEKLRVFQQHFDAFRSDFKAKLRTMLITIRSGCEDIGTLNQLLKRFENQKFTFNPHRLGLWLREKHEELCMVQRFQDQITSLKLNQDRIVVFPNHRLLREQMATCTVRETFQFVFTSLARSETLLAHMENPTIDTDPMMDSCETVVPWYRDKQVIERMEQEFLNFTAFIKSNIEDKCLAFALTTLDANDETCTTGSSIFVYQRGILTQKNAIPILTSRMKMKVFANRIAQVLKMVVKKAFVHEMIEKTANGIKNEKWLNDARLMHKFMDLLIANTLMYQQDQDRIQKIIYWIDHPKEFHNRILEELTADTVATTNINEAWNVFTITLKRVIQKAALATDPSADMNITRAQKFVNQLRIEFSKSGLSSAGEIDSALCIDCSGENDDLSSEEDVTFKEIWSRELIRVMDNQRFPINLDLDLRIKKDEYHQPPPLIEYTKFSRKVIEYMKSSPFTKFGESSRPRCDSCCPICKALCIEAANHDTRITPHNAIHQPAGIVGVSYRVGSDLPDQIPNSLIATTCSQRYALDRSFYPNPDSEESYSFEEFFMVFPGWKNPLINEDVPLRQYIFAQYNDEIAEQYHMEPCVEIPRNYYRDLWAIKKQLEMDTQTLNLEIGEHLGIFRF